MLLQHKKKDHYRDVLDKTAITHTKSYTEIWDFK